MSHYWYRGFGLLIRSELELPELPPGPPGNHKIDLVIRRGPLPKTQPVVTLDEELAINNPGAGFLIRNGREITVDVWPDADPATVRVLLLGRVMGFLFRQRGWLPLHASGVVIAGKECVLFLGVAGAGKSTTAAAFHKQGHTVVTDDVAPVRITGDGTCLLQSAWPCVRLRADARATLGYGESSAGLQAGKLRYDLHTGISPGNLYPVRRAYVIEFGQDIVLEPVDPIQAVPLLSRHSFVKHRILTREALQLHLRDCTAVANAISVRRLIRPRSLVDLPSVVRCIEKDLVA